MTFNPPFSFAGLVLSLFPGADLLGRGFESVGFCVVRGPDLVYGSDIREFHALPGRFNGVIGGSPCQDFSKARRSPPTGNGAEMLSHYCRVVAEAKPDWFLHENVPGVPHVEIEGYTVQRFNLNARECGVRQNRLRAFQFGSRDGRPLVIHRAAPISDAEPCCLANEGKSTTRRDFSDFCELMGLPRNFDLPGLSVAAKYRAVGNGVPVPMARLIAQAVADRGNALNGAVRLCACDCGRPVVEGHTTATPACRKRMQRRRDAAGIAERVAVT